MATHNLNFSKWGIPIRGTPLCILLYYGGWPYRICMYYINNTTVIDIHRCGRAGKKKVDV
jgi:hypothetical protein